jgi:hypothetical protein
MKARRLLLLILIAAIVSVFTTSAQLAPFNNSTPVQQTATIPMLPGTAQPLAAVPGNQTDPHVACGVATYTTDELERMSLIRYVDFAANTNLFVLGTGNDRLSDTDGRKIAFTISFESRDQIFVYDVVDQTTWPIPVVESLDPAVAGNLVAFVHPTSTTSSEIDVFDLGTLKTTPLTNDALENRAPAISPDGKVVVWEKCQGNGVGCDIYAATKTSQGTFATRRLTDAGQDRFADTNGQLVAYVSDKSGENDVYLQRIDGSNEMHLTLPGDQRNVHISGSLVVFESKTGFWWDVFLYDLSSARLYQVTNTARDESSSDVVAGCDGVNRIVYTTPGPFGDFDVWQFEFHTAKDEVDDLSTLVQSFNIPEGTKASLTSKLQDALAALAAGNTATACDSLTAFINASQAQSDKKLTAAQVRQLVDAAVQIKADIGCQ